MLIRPKKGVDEKVQALHIEISREQRMKLIVEENVRLQLEHLQEYPFVRTDMNAKKLNLHGRVYDMSCGAIRIIKTERPNKA